ncbi:MAG: class I SAM-dependent methyltransferase [Candidatus Wolfebacteria bacterium]|nr:class I SAM-dependent methyltransferase [Candidatus Wolfebacteria bacterium]
MRSRKIKMRQGFKEMDNFKHRNDCRICGGSDFFKILDLGEMPPANAFLKKEDLDKPELKFPLVLYFCRKCGLVQLLDIVNPKVLFGGQYDYLTSASKPLVEHFREMAGELVRKFVESQDDLALEIGGNDGTLLHEMKNRCRVLNIDPAVNMTELSQKRGVPSISRFFSSETAEEILKEYGMAKVIVANNVTAHIDDIKDVFKGVEALLSDDGVFVFEAHWVGNLIGDGGFDQIYHEHLSYYSLTALKYLIGQFGLKIFDVELVPVHGESLRVYVGKNREVGSEVGNFLTREKEMGLDKEAAYADFSEKVLKNKKDAVGLLSDIKKNGKKIIGYGAPAKGNTLLNYFGITGETLDFITDTTPTKQGLYTPGSHIPVYPPEKLFEAKPDYLLLLAWNYADAIIKKEAGFREKGGKFIIPVPEVKIV